MSRPEGANQERFLGALLGMAIGDALGMPVAGWSAERIRVEYGRIDRYHPRAFADGAEIKAGEFTDESEVALCIVESATADGGALDPDKIGARLAFLARGESKRWMDAATLAALSRAEQSLAYQVPIAEDDPATGDVAARGIPVGMLHAVGNFEEGALRADAELVARLTHGSPLAIAAVAGVAFTVQLAARGEIAPRHWAAETARFLRHGAAADALAAADAFLQDRLEPGEAITRLGVGEDAPAVIASGVYAAMTATEFEAAVFAAVNAGGAADGRGAIAGSLAGAWFGAGGIPQALIDDLEGRIYISLAAPWFYRTARRRAGLVLDLRRE